MALGAFALTTVLPFDALGGTALAQHDGEDGEEGSDGKGPGQPGDADTLGGKPVWAQEGIPEVEVGKG